MADHYSSRSKKNPPGSTGHKKSSASKSRSRKRRKPQNHFFIMKLLILVVVVLTVFEGKLVYRMFSSSDDSSIKVTGQDTTSDAANTQTKPESVSSVKIVKTATGANGLVGLATLSSSGAADTTKPAAPEPATEASDPWRVSEVITDSYCVQERSPAVDDSYFRDAVFIGDSRMEGFRNTSGITQGTFMTSVGMCLTSISDSLVASPEGAITVYQGLSGRQYSKIYIMLGTNDLGFYPMSEFLNTAKAVFDQMHQLQPYAQIYVCSVIYVEESKVVTDYVNNKNVIEVNENLQQACRDLDYCHYINLNEIFSNGYQSLIEGASQDGVHLYEKYSVQMLEYLKKHYLDVAPVPEKIEEPASEAS